MLTMMRDRKKDYDNFYDKLHNLSHIEKDNPDLSKPFNLYCGRIRLTVQERLNLLERETLLAY